MQRYFLVMYQYIKPFSSAVEFGNTVVKKEGGFNGTAFCVNMIKESKYQQVGVLFFREMTEQEYEDYTR